VIAVDRARPDNELARRPERAPRITVTDHGVLASVGSVGDA
jgi:hypothetical protein